MTKQVWDQLDLVEEQWEIEGANGKDGA